MSRTTIQTEPNVPANTHRLEDHLNNPPTKTKSSYHDITLAVVDILRTWAHRWAGDPKWQSFLNKSRLLEEAEECIVALHHLLEWRKQQSTEQHQQQQQEQQPKKSWIAVDVCCGKGLFAMFLSYLTSYFPNEFQGLQRIVLLDKAKIDYHHIHEANSTCQQDSRPFLELWEHCNLHDYDALLDRFQCFACPVALTGIHLCNMLSPACLGLANGLGPQMCPYLCLAPCCLPRLARVNKNLAGKPSVDDGGNGNLGEESHPQKDTPSYTSVLAIQCFETNEERNERRRLQQQREDAMRRRKNDKRQTANTEPTPPPNDASSQSSDSAVIPCWKCGQVGHFKAQCPSLQASSRPPRVVPPMHQISVDDVWKSPRPFESYCHVLARTLQDPICLQVVEAGIGRKVEDAKDSEKDKIGSDARERDTTSPHSRHGNWNAHRKNIFIVATR